MSTSHLENDNGFSSFPRNLRVSLLRSVLLRSTIISNTATKQTSSTITVKNTAKSICNHIVISGPSKLSPAIM